MRHNQTAMWNMLKGRVPNTLHQSLIVSVFNPAVDLIRISSYVKNYESTTTRFLAKQRIAGDETSSGAQNVAWNPLATFHLLRRMSTTLRSLVPAIDMNSGTFRNKIHYN